MKIKKTETPENKQIIKQLLCYYLKLGEVKNWS